MQRYCIFQLLTNRNKKENMKTTILQSTILSIILMLCFTYKSMAQDSIPPVVHNVSIITDTVYNQDSVFVLLDVSDDISGIDWSFVLVVLNPFDTVSNITGSPVLLSNFVHVQGNVYRGSGAAIEPYLGTYHAVFTGVVLSDNAGNNTNLLPTDTVFLNNPDTLVMIGNAIDTVGPELISVSFDKTAYVYGDTIGLTIVARDLGSGIRQLTRNFYDHYDFKKYLSSYVTTVTSNDTFYYKLKLPLWAADGNWKLLEINLTDNAGNATNYYDSIDYNGRFIATGMLLDTVPPTLLSLTSSPKLVHRGDTVMLQVEVYDSISGMNSSGVNQTLTVRYKNKFGQQEENIFNMQRVSNSNIYEGKFKVNEFGADGPWNATEISAKDIAGNYSHIYSYSGNLPALLDTFYVVPDSSRIVQGHVLTSTGAPLENSRVYMVKVVPVDSILISFRTAYTDANGDYQFISELRDSVVYFKAVPNDTFYVDEMPTYLDTAWLFADARVVRIDSQLTIIDTFATLQGFNIGGHGFVQGHIYSGAGKTGAQLPVANQTLILVDASNKPIAFTTTNAMGEYQFENIPDGTYRLYADWPGIDNKTAPTIAITPDEFSLNDFDYEVVDNSLMRITIGITETSAASAGITVYPNPVQGKFLVNVSTKTDAVLSFKLFDINGKRIKGVAVRALGTNQWEISAGTLPNGNYFLGISEGSNNWQVPVLVVE